jgi:adenosine/AMP kinase
MPQERFSHPMRPTQGRKIRRQYSLSSSGIVSEVATIYCATSNPVQVIVAKTETSRSVIGIVDGLSSRAIESEDDKQNRSKLLRDLGYKK